MLFVSYGSKVHPSNLIGMAPACDESKPRPLYPQPLGGLSQPVFQSRVSKPRKKQLLRQQVAVACLPCQKRKCRCDGKRPTCSSCVSRNRACEYNIEEGLTRVAHLKQENRSLADSAKDLQAIVNILRKGTDSEAAATLARLRVGDPISAITRSDSISSDDTLHHGSRAGCGSQTESSTAVFTVPEHVKTLPFFDRRKWGENSPQRGLAAFAFPTEATSSQQSPQTTSIWEYEDCSPATTVVGQYRPPHMETVYHHHEQNPRNFGNLDFSSGILTNNHPYEIQSQQISNLFAPHWSTKSVATSISSDHPMAMMAKALGDVYLAAKEMLDNGATIVEVAGEHPRIGAILDDKEFERSPMLSQFCAKVVFAIKESNRAFVSYSSMYLFWWVLRWMLYPTPQTYSAIPSWLRPTPNQLFMPHIMPIDFFAWPGFRDYVTRVPEIFEKPEWIMDMSLNIEVEWPGKIEDALAPSAIDGELDLCPEALAYASRLESWSVKPSFRKYLVNADRYLRVKFEDE